LAADSPIEKRRNRRIRTHEFKLRFGQSECRCADTTRRAGARTVSNEDITMSRPVEMEATDVRLARVELTCSTDTVTAVVEAYGEPTTETARGVKAESADAAVEVEVRERATKPVVVSPDVEETKPLDAQELAASEPRPAARSRTTHPVETYQGTALTGDWKRPPLDSCLPEDFMLDFLRFSESRSDDWECVWDALDNALRRTGKPCDVLGFYKEVCRRGGYVDRASAKKRIKMGYAFMQTHNYYDNHTYTDIGNKLLDLYERFLLPYEIEHPEDICDAICPGCEDANRGGSKVKCDGCMTAYHPGCVVPRDLVRKSRCEIFTSFVCSPCTENARVANSGGIEVGGKKRTLEEIDVMNCERLEAFVQRTIAMRKRRGRPHDESFVSPTRPEISVKPVLEKALARKETASRDPKPARRAEVGEPSKPASFLVGPAL